LKDAQKQKSKMIEGSTYAQQNQNLAIPITTIQSSRSCQRTAVSILPRKSAVTFCATGCFQDMHQNNPS